MSQAQELLLFYLVASEVGTAYCIRRVCEILHRSNQRWVIDVQHFDWTNNTLLFEDIPNGLDPKRTAFFLGGEDMVIDAKVSIGVTETFRGADLCSGLGHTWNAVSEKP